jgi:flagellar hook assembly protein FlgD
MKKFLLIAVAAIICAAFNTTKSNAQTTGTLTFSVTTTEPSGGYTGANCLAIWVENGSGTFIKTKMRYAQSRVQYLNTWITKSSQNVVDAVTGATLNNHGTRTITWNATNISAVLVPDDTYKIWMQMADRNSNGPTASITFTKGPTPIVNQTFANSGNFTNMTLNWTPSNSNTETINMKASLSCFPNPFIDKLTVNFNLSDLQRVNVSIYNPEGSLVKILADEMMAEGIHNLNWDATNSRGNQVSKGIFFIKVTAGGKSTVKKVVLSR